MIRFVFIGTILCLLALGCAEDFDLNAPEEDIWVVYGVLNPNDSVQYVRISKAFQPRSNALDSAQIGSFTVKGLHVQLKGTDQVYEAKQVDRVGRNSNGDFGPLMTLYEFKTKNDRRLRVGERYELHITADSLEGFSLNANCRIPSHPRIISPVTSGNFNRSCLTTAYFEDSVEVLFRKQSPGEPETSARAYDIRVLFTYLVNGEEKTYTFGPSRLFSGSRGCSSGLRSTLCYKYGNGIVLSSFKTVLNDTSLRYIYQAEPSCAPARAYLPKALRIQVTAIDSALGTYMQLNDPGQVDFTSYRPEFTNIIGTERAIGIFGGIAVGESPVSFSGCARYLLRLNGIKDSTLCN